MGSSHNWVIEYDKKAIGTINVCYSDDNTEICGIAYALSYHYWSKGIVTEAVKAVVSFLFNRVNYRKIIAGSDSKNVGSRKVMKNFQWELIP